MITVKFWAIVLLFIYGMLRCSDYMKIPPPISNEYETPVGFIWEICSKIHAV